jgi:hypothetical protein
MIYFNITKNKFQPSKTNMLLLEKLPTPREGPGFSKRALLYLTRGEG